MKTFRRRGKTAGIPLLFQSVSFISSCFLGAHGSYHLVWYGWKASSPCCGGHSCIGLKNLGVWRGFLGGLVVKNPPANAGDVRGAGSSPGPGRSPAEGNGNPLQYSRLENPMDRGAWWAPGHGLAKSQLQLSE